MKARSDAEAQSALDDLDAELENLLAAVEDLEALPAEQLITFTQGFETFRRRLSLVDHRIVQALEAAEVPAFCGVKSTHRFLSQLLRVSQGEAKRRVEAAHALLAQRTPVGESLAAKRPQVAAAQRTGEISAEQVQVILHGLDRIDRLISAGHGDVLLVSALERDLVELASTFDPSELRRCVERAVECVDPDGVLADDRAQQALRELHLVARPDGLYSLRGVLTAQAGASLSAVLVPLAAPRATCESEGSVIGADDRDYPARLHDALEEAADRLLRSGTLPVSGGVPATVLITADAVDLERGQGFGRAADGTLVPVKGLSAWADEADVITVGITAAGEVLDRGRQKRFASKNQVLALIARDEACTFPGCDHPPQWCDHHHVQSWLDGGPTDLANLTLLCRYHHHRFERLGWDCRMIDGLPHWIPPRWADPEQKPVLNQRLRDRRARRTERLTPTALFDPGPVPAPTPAPTPALEPA